MPLSAARASNNHTSFSIAAFRSVAGMRLLRHRSRRGDGLRDVQGDSLFVQRTVSVAVAPCASELRQAAAASARQGELPDIPKFSRISLLSIVRL